MSPEPQKEQKRENMFMMYSEERKDWIFTEVIGREAKGEAEGAKSDILSDLYSALEKK
jgi:hypothetical protein